MPQTNSVDTNSPPRQREAGSPCVFVVIYRVSPARLSDCICLCGALPCSHFTPSRLPSLQTCRPYKTLVLLRSATVCMRVSWPNVTLQGSSFGIWAFSKRLNSCLSALFLNHFHFSGSFFSLVKSSGTVAGQARPESSPLETCRHPLSRSRTLH